MRAAEPDGAAFAIDAEVTLEPGGEADAVGASVTSELCGSWNHDGPCRWPHNTRVVGRDGAAVRTRTVIVAATHDQAEVLDRTRQALESGRIVPDSGRDSARWRLVRADAGTIEQDEHDLARRLANVTPT